MDKQKETEVQERQFVVEVNTNANNGPLDGAKANVKVTKTSFKSKDFVQELKEGSISATALHGVVSIKVGSTMFTVRLDEMIEVINASVKAYASIYTKPKEKGDDTLH